VKADMLAVLMAASLRNDDPLPAPHNRYRVKCHPHGYWYDKQFRVETDPGVNK